MRVIKLELRSPQKIDGIALDPQPDWTFDSLLLELNSIEEKLNVNSLPFTKIQSRELPVARSNGRTSKGFVMHVSDDEIDDVVTDSEEEVHNQLVVAGTRFGCDDLYISDDSDDEPSMGIQCSLMDPVGLVEGALHETTHEHQLSVAEEMRNQISALEADLINENEKFVSTLKQVEKDTEVKRDMDRKLDMQYQRKMAEALDNHLTAVQRDHEHKSQIEERRLRDDAAREEVKRREKSLQEEKARQEKLKAEAEVQARQEAERVKSEKAAAEEAERRAAATAAAEEAERSAAKQASEKNAPQTSTKSVSEGTIGQSNMSKKLQPSGNIIRGAESALNLEERRMQIYKEVAKKNEALGLGTNEDYRKHGMQISRRIKTINGLKENVRVKADELTKLISNSSCPQSIGIAMFAEKFVSISGSGSSNSTVYGYGRVIVSVTSKIPQAMDILIAELNKVCIFTVPKYIQYTESSFESKEAHNKSIGYQVEDGTIESTDSYVRRMSSYMKLYGAIVQTEVEGFQNLHGITEGWAWLARFLNAVPANLYTAMALHAFLEIAGFALFKRYKSQFIKLVNIIEHDFVKSIQVRENPSLAKVIANLLSYIQSRQFLKEPEGRQLQTSLDSHNFVPDSGYEEQQQHYYPSNNFSSNNYNNNNYNNNSSYYSTNYNSNRRY